MIQRLVTLGQRWPVAFTSCSTNEIRGLLVGPVHEELWLGGTARGQIDGELLDCHDDQVVTDRDDTADNRPDL